MDIFFHKDFFKSFKRMIDSENPLKLPYWVDKWYDLKWAFKNFFKYFKIVSIQRPWDSHFIIEMMKFQIKDLCNYLEKYGLEIEKDRLPKIKKMKRFIELADHYLDDDYADRCGFIYTDFKTKDKDGKIQLDFNETEEESKNNSRALKEAHELEEKEWNEMIEILKDMRSWWD